MPVDVDALDSGIPVKKGGHQEAQKFATSGLLAHSGSEIDASSKISKDRSV